MVYRLESEWRSDPVDSWVGRFDELNRVMMVPISSLDLKGSILTIITHLSFKDHVWRYDTPL